MDPQGKSAIRCCPPDHVFSEEITTLSEGKWELAALDRPTSEKGL